MSTVRNRALGCAAVSSAPGDVDPVRDLQTIRQELLIKDMEFVNRAYGDCAAAAKRNARDKEAQEKYKAFTNVKEWVEAGAIHRTSACG